MPELPEVETTRRGIEPHILDKRIVDVIVRNRRLRWPLPAGLKKKLVGQKIIRIARRAKYLLLYLDAGCVIWHLGMSGSLRVLKQRRPPSKHDHIDIVFAANTILRFRDPRRFGSLHWTAADPLEHRLLGHLGPEPLGRDFSGEYLHKRAGRRRQAVKTFIMDSRIVVGVGNIYASEALFLAGIHPKRAAGRISKARYIKLARAIRRVLAAAIKKGGTTLRDFADERGQPGYFRIELKVYDREGRACKKCSALIKQIRQGQRSTFYCSSCQQ